MKLRAFPIALLLLVAPLAVGQTVWRGSGPFVAEGPLAAGQWAHYAVDASDAEGLVRSRLTHSSGEMDLYIRRGEMPNGFAFDVRPLLENQPEQVDLTNDSAVPLLTGRVFISVNARSSGNFRLEVSKAVVASTRTGMGAIPWARGTTFRVWAPFANSVSVAGTFNRWKQGVAPLVSEGGGIWSLDLRGAQEGHEYKFVITNGTQTLWKNDPRARRLTNSVGNSVIFGSNYNWTSNSFSTPTWDRMVVYQMHIGTFNDVPGGTPGSFDTAIEKLDDIKDLGVNTILLLPVHEFAGDFSWGYNPAYPFSVESAYGGPERLKKFIDEAHKRGLAVMLDVVYNHFGPSDLDMWRFDGWFQNNWGGIYFYQDGRAVTPWGDTRPDFGRNEVRQYLRDNALQWLEEFRADGLRFDSTLNIRRTNWGDNGDGWSLMQWINNEIDARQPWKITMAEDLQGDSWITRATSSGGAGFDTQWSAQFVHPVRAEITKPWDSDRDMWAIRSAVLDASNGWNLLRTIYTESHDEVANGRQRVPSEIDPSNAGSYWARRRSTLGAALVFTSPGIPMMFMGQEFLEDGWFSDTDPLDWSKRTTYSGIRQMYKDLINLRTNAGGFTAGLTGNNINFFHTNNSGKVVAFHRWKNGGFRDDVVVLMNFSNTYYNDYRIGIPVNAYWSVVFSSDWTGYSPDFWNTFNGDFWPDNWGWDGLSFSKSLRLPPYSTIILARRW